MTDARTIELSTSAQVLDDHMSRLYYPGDTIPQPWHHVDQAGATIEVVRPGATTTRAKFTIPAAREYVADLDYQAETARDDGWGNHRPYSNAAGRMRRALARLDD